VNAARQLALAADAEARDVIAALLDRHLAGVPTVRRISARILTRSPAREGGNTTAKLAAALDLPKYALTSGIQRAGGASMLELRDEIVLVRLAYVFGRCDATWPLAAEVIGVPYQPLLKRTISRRRHVAPGRWKIRVRPAIEATHFQAFLKTNAPAWFAAMRIRATPTPTNTEAT